MRIVPKLLGLDKCLDLKPRKPQCRIGKKGAHTNFLGAVVTDTSMSAEQLIKIALDSESSWWCPGSSGYTGHACRAQSYGQLEA